MSAALLLEIDQAREESTSFDIWHDRCAEADKVQSGGQASLDESELVPSIWSQNYLNLPFGPLTRCSTQVKSNAPTSRPAAKKLLDPAKITNLPPLPVDKVKIARTTPPISEDTKADNVSLHDCKAPKSDQLDQHEAERMLLSRAHSAPVLQHTRTISAALDEDFLGPVDRFDPSTRDRVKEECFDVVKSQLAQAMQALADMRLEVQDLRKSLADRELVDSKSCLREAEHNETHVDNADTDIVDYSSSHVRDRWSAAAPTNDLIHAIEKPVAGTGVHRRWSETALNSAEDGQAWHDTRYPMDIDDGLASEAHVGLQRQNLPITDSFRYNHLRFFPGTTNVPSATHDRLRAVRDWCDEASPSNDEGASFDMTCEKQRTVPCNYQRIMERNTEMNWVLVVEKIIAQDDQQASVALQQKLKIGPSEQKNAIINAVLVHALELMINRFGNFLIQRCFEHGTPEQIKSIADAIRGNVLALSMDAFGCHVVQKSLDNIPEDLKLAFVDELLLHIPDTITHRYACHVWQKLFEIRWSNRNPEIMSRVNAEMRGTWADIAMGETGSLVVQNIFENCVDSDKLPCTREVMASVPTIVCGQWGNWVIQHILEHGEPHNRAIVLDIVMENAVEYSLDQYASKVIERAIKSGDTIILQRYLKSIINQPAAHRSRPRMPLIDIASDQYGNYILLNGSLEQKATVIAPIRKHMVSMRGSRSGSKVAFLVERLRHHDTTDRSDRNFRGGRGPRARPYGSAEPFASTTRPVF